MKQQFLPHIKQSKGSEDFYNLDLCYIDDEQNISPKITFEISENEILKSLDSLKISGSELVKQSFKNLSSIKIKFEDATVDDEGLLIFEQKYASEKVLDKTFIESIAKQLGTDKILASLPARNSLLICSAENAKATDQLIKKTQRIFNDFSKEPISSMIFTIENGSIKSAYSPKMSLESKDNSSLSFGSYSENITKIKLFQDLYNYRILASASKIEDLQNGLFNSVIKLLEECRNDSNFKKSIETISSVSEIKKSRENRNKIKLLLDKVGQNYQSESSPSPDNKIKLSFQFHQDFQNGNNHNKIIKHLN